MFLGYQNNKIVLTANTRAELENAPCMSFDRIEETEVNYTLYGGEYLTPEEIEVKEKETQRQEIISQMDAYDLKSIRPMRAKDAGTATQEDLDKLEEYEEIIAQLRQQLKDL